MTPETLVGLLADPARMRVLAAVALGARTDADTSSAAALSAKEAAIARRKLTDGGLVVQAPDGWAVDYPALRAAARDQAARRDSDSAEEVEPGARGLVPYVVGRRLVSLPSRQSRRREVLEHIATTTFAPGKRYDERAVNELLALWCAGGAVDHVTVRRYLVDGRLLVRGNGIYTLPSQGAAPEESVAEQYVRAMGLA